MRPIRALILLLLVSCTVSAQSVSVTVYRDSKNMHHVVSTDAEAAWYGLGLLQMRQLPVTVTRNLAQASGELASVVGPGPIDPEGFEVNVISDLRMQLFRVGETATRQIQLMPTDVKLRLEAFVDGLNDQRLVWLASPSQLAFNTEPIYHDAATITRLMSRPITLDDVVRLGVHVNGINAMSSMVGLAYASDPNASEMQLLEASNSLAVGPRATQSSVPMLVVDPHLGFQDPPQLRAFFAHVIAGSENVGGVTFPGFPCIAMGFNGSLAWALTSNNPDVSDVWKTSTDSTGSSFLFDGAPVAILRESAVVSVWDESIGAVVPRPAELAYAGSHDRPILREIAGVGGQDGTIWYGGATFDTDVSLWEFFIRFGQAPNVKKARNVFDLNVIMSNNFLMADEAGMLGHMAAGRVPQRGAPTPGTDWSQVQDGSSSQWQWSSVHSASELPYEQLADRGNLAPVDQKWVQCNATPDIVRIGSSISLTDFPDYMINAAAMPLSWRQVRGRELLSSSAPISGQDLRDIAIDDLDLWWRAVEPLAIHVMTEFGLWQDAQLAATINRMMNWNRSTDPDLAEPLISHLVHAFYAKGVFDSQETSTPLPSYSDFTLPDEVPDMATFTSASWQPIRAILASALQQADQTWRSCINAEMPQFLFPLSPWTPAPWGGLTQTEPVWGTAHYTNLTPFTDPLSAAGYPVAGNVSMLAFSSSRVDDPWKSITSDATVNGQTGTLIEYPIDAGAHTVMHVELHSGAPSVWFLEGIGASEIASDPDRYRHAAAFAAGQWQTLPVEESDIAAGALAAETLSYTPSGIGTGGGGGGNGGKNGNGGNNGNGHGNGGGRR